MIRMRLGFAGKLSLLLLPVTVILFSCIREETSPLTPTVTPINRIEVLSVKDHFGDALEVAQGWQSDAYLQSASASVRPNDDSRTLQIFYEFLSNHKRSEALLIWILEDNTIDSKTVNLAGSTRNRREIEKEEWVLDSLEAVQIALEHGGNEYISKYGSVDIDVFLERQWRVPNNDIVIWRASFLRPEGGGNMNVEINAVTGEVIGLIQ